MTASYLWLYNFKNRECPLKKIENIDLLKKIK